MEVPGEQDEDRDVHPVADLGSADEAPDAAPELVAVGDEGVAAADGTGADMDPVVGQQVAAPGGAAVPDCVDPGMGSICFLNCSGGAECPAGMVCQQALTTEGARSLCFVEPG